MDEVKKEEIIVEIEQLLNNLCMQNDSMQTYFDYSMMKELDQEILWKIKESLEKRKDYIDKDWLFSLV
ncbi:hypothetical protein [Helicobacter anatolicus]|uniref:hypothetical protein n=1 Tax=Helicobacter anatolicus TaxID=2905874 RepID=UPI001E37516F|nr:hypothetical protein [Helicobacter anatolicus]MCE3037431.1 hypothetical protein [Helicobacter anatolicus]MCE3040224.1 hypothetical protein [Helicobacter anatolicus]